MRTDEYKKGLLSMITCMLLWGFMPLYWQLLRPVDSYTIILYRIILIAVVCLLVCFFQFGVKGTFEDLLRNKKKTWLFAVAGIVLTINWSLYIWAVNADYVIQTCMGYYFEPLVVCLFGMVFFREKAGKLKLISIIIAFVGLGVMVYGYREFPLIAIGLGLSFAIYSAIKKNIDLPPMKSLLYETMFLVPPSIIGIFAMEKSGVGIFAQGFESKMPLLMLAGIVTALPMAFFSIGAVRLPLITIGLLEYISPSIALILGIFFLKEPFDAVQFAAFAIVWIGLIFFSASELKSLRRKDEKED